MIQQLVKAKFLQSQCTQFFTENFSDMTVELFKNEATNHGKGGASRYETMIREFALTLYFYSPRGYRFVRKTLSLPAPSTLRSWASKVTVQPGFLTNVLLGLKENTASNDRNCIVIVDEMSIRSETIWDDNSSKFVGTVDYGGIQGE